MERTILLRSVVVALVLSAFSGLFFGRQAALAVAVGAIIAGVNFRLSFGALCEIVPGAGPSAGRRRKAVLFLLRYLMVGAALVAAITAGVRPIFLIVGVSSLVLAILSSAPELVKRSGEA